MHVLMELKLSCMKNALWGSLPKFNMWYGFVQVGYTPSFARYGLES